jgi:hypothetical protein
VKDDVVVVPILDVRDKVFDGLWCGVGEQFEVLDDQPDNKAWRERLTISPMVV